MSSATLTSPHPAPALLRGPRKRIGVDLLLLSQFMDTGMVTYVQAVLPRLFAALPDCEWILFLKDGARLSFDPADHPNVAVKRSPWMRSAWAWKLAGVVLEPLLEGLDLLFIPLSRAPLIKTSKLIVFVHDMGFLSLPEYLEAGTLQTTRLAMRAAQRQADLLLTNSLFTRREFCRHYRTPESRLEVTYLGFDPNQFHPCPAPGPVAEQVLRRYGICPPYVLYVGVIQGRKNLLRLIEAQAIWRRQKPDLRLVIAGRKGWNCEEIYARAAGSDGEVLLTGPVAPEHLAILYQQAECFTLPSLYEGFGLPAIEAMACGVPVALSESGALPEVGADAARYFDPKDPRMMAETILGIVQSPEVRRRMIASGLRRAAQFEWSRIAESTARAFEKVLAEA